MVLAMMFGTGAWKINAQAAPKAILDISEWQGRLNANQVQQLKPRVAFIINRRQYGSGYEDRDAVNNTQLYVRYGIPFGEYDFATFASPSSARQEARTFYARSNKHALFYALDFEVNSVRSGSSNAAVDAWFDQMRALTSKKLIFCSYASFATTYANQARQRFNAQWIAAYSRQHPSIPCGLWQYTSHYRIAGLPTVVDNNRVITSVHPLAWWTATNSVVKPVKLTTKAPHRVQLSRREVTKPRARVVVQHRRRPRVTRRIVRRPVSKPNTVRRYYQRLPRRHEIVIRRTTAQYLRPTFTVRDRIHKRLRRGQIIKVTQIGRRANGTWYFKMRTGGYVTANRQVVKE